MAASREDIERWIETAKKDKKKFIISMCDTWDYDDYPIYCKDEVELEKEFSSHNGKNMQSVNEIIKVEGKKVTENLTYNQAIKG